MSINIVSTYTADVMRPYLEPLIQFFSTDDTVFIYNQIFEQLLFPESACNTNRSGANILLLRVSDLVDKDAKNKKEDGLLKIKEILNILKSSTYKPSVPLIIAITPSDSDSETQAEFYLFAEQYLLNHLKKLKNTFVLNSKDIINNFTIQNIYNSFTEQHGHIPYTMHFYQSLGIALARQYSLLSRKPYKVIVLDCDGTLWDGVIEEDGIEGVFIDSYYKEIQAFFIACFERGFLICLCSKNSENSVLSVFKDKEDMVLDLENHICTHRVNWQSKSENIKDIARELDLGLDSFIFVDDNPVECAQVKAEIPSILSVNLPREKKERLIYLKNIWAFDTFSESQRQVNRTEFYKKNKLRKQLESSSHSFSDFLEKLQIKTQITEVSLNDFERVNELNDRTNQFNLTPQSMNHLQIHEAITTGKPKCMKVEVSDRYMDYGLVGVFVYQLFSDYLFVPSFFLSCRILSRGVELEVLKYLRDIAEKNDIKALRFAFLETDRNIPAMTFLKKITGSNKLSSQYNFVTLPIKKIDTLTPVFFAQTNVSKKKNTGIIAESKDYFLNIAQSIVSFRHSLENKKSKVGTEDIHSLRISFLEILKQYDLSVEQKDIPLIFLGLSSLQSVLIAGEIFTTYHVVIKPQEILQKELTIEKLFEMVLAKTKQTQSVNNVIDFDSNVLSLSGNQMRLWYDEKLSETPTSRNIMYVAFQASSPINRHCLNKAFNRIVEKHDVFRFRFYEVEDEPFIKVSSSESPFQVEYVTLDEDASEAYIKQVIKKPFHLKKDVLLRVSVINPSSKKPVLLICTHHIIHDGWSLNVLLKDLSYFYRIYSKGHGIHLKKSNNSQYAQYILWQQKHINPSVLDEQKAFWSRYLQKLPALELVSDYLKTEKQSQKCDRITFQIDKSTSKNLQVIARHYHVTLFDLLSTAFGIFLSHLSNQEDVHFVTASSGRTSGAFAEAIGFFVNLLVIRLHIHPDKSLAEQVMAHKKTIESAFSHQDLSFNDILQAAGEGVNSKTHFFSQAGFIFQSYPIHDLELDNGTAKRIHTIDKAQVIYDDCDECRFANLVCFIQPQKDALYGMFEYNVSLYDKKTIRFFIQSFKSLLKNIALDDKTPVMGLPLLDKRQKNLILNVWNHDVLPYPPSVNLVSEFEVQAKLYPNAVCIKGNEYQWTYSEVHKLSNQLARELVSKGVAKETRVGVFIEKSCEQIIAVLGVLKASGCYVPLSKELPYQRLGYIIDDSQLAFILVKEGENTGLPESAQEKAMIIAVSRHIATHEQTDIPLPWSVYSNQLACILYTSGSTGTPKGVMIEHSGIVRLVKDTNYIDIEHTDTIALTSNFLFDASTFEIWGALLNGAALAVPPDNVFFDKNLLQQYIRKEKVSILFLTTQLFHTYAMLEPKVFKHLKCLLVGGDVVLTEAIKKTFHQSHRPKVFINGYGPTENTTFSTAYRIENKRQIYNPVPIGKPISGTKVYVLGKQGNLLPINAPGRLYVSGIGLARQYVNKDELTNERFISYCNERLYDTGDIVCWQNDGNLRYLGREDNQIKINGYRIELNEIESTLDRHPLVEQAVVLVKYVNHTKWIVAFILLKEDLSLQEVNLYHHLLSHIPAYMMPNAFYQVDSMPLTNNGKIDRKQLLKQDLEAISYTEFEAPSNAIETKLSKIFSDILHIPLNEISVNAEFFDLGGNSVSVLHLIHLVNSEFKVSVTFSLLYEFSTIKLLAEKVGEVLANRSKSGKNRKIHQVIQNVKKGADNKVPIVFVHPIGGTGFCYLDLIRLLPKDQPCYLIQDPSIDADEIMFESITEMGSYYNALLLSHFQNREFILAGFSFGGMLSIEMTDQFSKENMDSLIKGIITFDTWIVSRLLNMEVKEALKASIMSQYELIANNLKRQNINPRPWMELYYKRLQELGFSYVPPRIKKKIVLFKASEQKGEFSAMSHESNFLSLHTTEDVELYSVPGDHNSILQKPYVHKISNILENHPLLVRDDGTIKR